MSDINYDVEVYEDNAGGIAVYCTNGTSHRIAFGIGGVFHENEGQLYNDIKDAAATAMRDWDGFDIREGDDAITAYEELVELSGRPSAVKMVASVINAEVTIHVPRMGRAALHYAGFV